MSKLRQIFIEDVIMPFGIEALAKELDIDINHIEDFLIGKKPERDLLVRFLAYMKLDEAESNRLFELAKDYRLEEKPTIH